MDLFPYLVFLWIFRHIVLYFGMPSSFKIKFQALYIKTNVVAPDNVIFL